MSRDYLHDGEYRLAVELNSLEEEIVEPNRTYAIGYKDYLELNNRKQRTLARRLGELSYILQLLNKDAKKTTKEDVEALIRAINKGRRRDTNQELSIATKRKLKMTLRSFYRWLFGSVKLDIVDWIIIEPDNLYKLPEEMLNEQDIKNLIENCRNQRDKAIIALLWILE